MNVNWLTSTRLKKLIITNATSTTQAAFLGIFAIDTLPQQIPSLPVLLVVNNDTSNLSGRHWKAIFISCQRQGEVFDSLATPVSITLEKWMNTFTNKWICSTLTIQHPISPSCGAFVLHYILHRLRQTSLKSYTEKYFDSELHVNETRIRHFMRTLKNK